MSKRTKFITTSLLLSLGFFGLSLIPDTYRYGGIASLSLLSCVLFCWSLKEGLGRNATLLALILPVFYTLGVGLFWFLLPSTLLATLPVIIMYGVGVYVLVSTYNIFVVSTFKKIALSRAANGVGFVLTLFTLFLLCDAILSLRSSLYIRTPVIFFVAFPLFVQGLWISELSDKINREVVIYSLAFAAGVASLSAILFFWPVSVIVGSLLLTVTTYVLLGLGQARFEGRLFKTTVREYLIVGFLVFIFMIISVSWR